ncbi:hypothetical protein CERSUDRAFT_91948 [Gelatoporia subvermispora B]|uniref:G domain-containing protein n=1 Tax=Ceriporiopsis subvermispora (strain B) TaxID=914234 RepID=M2RQM1_CERS8|nr:hypothetical protein CERSUDRAFT_91948 [Gelatoporia subvermispora B]
MEAPRPFIKTEPASDQLSLRADLTASIPTAADSELTLCEPLYSQAVESTETNSVYQATGEFSYEPQDALKEGLEMVKTIKTNVAKIDAGSSLRRDVWEKELKSLESQSIPVTMIAVCGATGAGKSSLLNAILDDNIVPTSGMRVITEISYHDKTSIDANVSFLSEKEWRQELGLLLGDLIDESGTIKRVTDLRSDAGVAWQKVHAVYPTITQDMIAKMSVDQIIAYDLEISAMLGTTKHMTMPNSTKFAEEIARYIDSTATQGIASGNISASGSNNTINDEDTLNASAFWPLIRQVHIKCNSRALATGATFIDLPGIADANAARDCIAKNYLKKCNYVWIVAPITRAVDDKSARDLMGDAFRAQLMMGAYDAKRITFIATKCDDISCAEVIKALHLNNDPGLMAIEGSIQEAKEQLDNWKKQKAAADSSIRACKASVKEARIHLKEYTKRLHICKRKPQNKSRLTATSCGDASTKRKHTSVDQRGSPKRRKADRSNIDNKLGNVEVLEDPEKFILEDNDAPQDIDSDSDRISRSDSDDDNDNMDCSQSMPAARDQAEQTKDDTVNRLKAMVQNAQDRCEASKSQMNKAYEDRNNASNKLSFWKKSLAEAQREKHATCSLRRSNYSRRILKEDFRQGLKDLDDAAAEQQDPDNFDPSVNLRNYNEIDLPVFTCSARDYIRIQGQVKGDGSPTCFSEVDHTGIPGLQGWCHKLSLSSCERAAQAFLVHIKTFATSVLTYVDGAGEAAVADCAALQELWKTTVPHDSEAEDDTNNSDDSSEEDSDEDSETDESTGEKEAQDDESPKGLALRQCTQLYALRKKLLNSDMDDVHLVGITPRLARDFRKVIDACTQELLDRFHDELDEKCRVGANAAAAMATHTSDEFAASMHWKTYRATLLRHGSWHRNLNTDLTNPFTRRIASSWSKVFEADLFASLETSAMDKVNKLLSEVKASAAGSLTKRARAQARVCVKEAHVTLQKTLTLVRDIMKSEQKEISRCLTPHVQTRLVDGYDRAMRESGAGSVARQKTVFKAYLNDIKHELFENAAVLLMSRLKNIVELIGKALKSSLGDLAVKMETSFAVLWEGPCFDPAELKTRAQVVKTVQEIVSQVELRLQTGRMKREVY